MHAEAMLLVDDDRARSLNAICSWNSACVPIRISMSPALSASRISVRSRPRPAAREQRNAQGSGRAER